eukprot:gene32440-39228_t
MHLELFSDKWPKPVLSYLPRKLFRPLAKMGIRTYSTKSTSYLEESVNLTFGATSNSLDGESGYNIGIFVYMYVAPALRGLGIGEILLDAGKDACRAKQDKYMLLIHDDNGSGKLIKYYQDRGFRGIDSFLPKGMLCCLKD